MQRNESENNYLFHNKEGKSFLVFTNNVSAESISLAVGVWIGCSVILLHEAVEQLCVLVGYALGAEGMAVLKVSGLDVLHLSVLSEVGAVAVDVQAAAAAPHLKIDVLADVGG